MSVKTELGPPAEIIDEPAPAKRSFITYALCACAILILCYMVYSKYIIHQPFWKKLTTESDKKDDSDSDDEESKKKEPPKTDSDVADWDLKKTIQQIEDAQRQLIEHKKNEKM